MLSSIESERNFPKSVVVSKFDQFLTRLEQFFQEKGFEVNRIHNEMEAEKILEVSQLFQNSSSRENKVLLANMEAISGDVDISSVHRVFFMEAVKECEENAVINHITGVKGKRNDIFQGAFRLIVKNSIENKIVGLKGKIEPGFKEFNMEEVENVLT